MREFMSIAGEADPPSSRRKAAGVLRGLVLVTILSPRRESPARRPPRSGCIREPQMLYSGFPLTGMRRIHWGVWPADPPLVNP